MTPFPDAQKQPCDAMAPLRRRGDSGSNSVSVMSIPGG